MRASDFDFHLPPHLIAQSPVEPRDAARLLVLDRAAGTVKHHIFRDLPELLRPGDVLVANDSRVLPARLYGHRASTGGAVEVLLLREMSDDEWMVLARPARRLRVGDAVVFVDGRLTATVLASGEDGERRLRLEASEGSIRDAIHHAGVVPLPPYIHAPLADSERYQTIYAREEGSVAAPTAGLHFTPDLLRRLAARDIVMHHVTLHVGAGTFKPMQDDLIDRHKMHEEWAVLDAQTAADLNAARADGRRIVAIGTTSVRVLESAAVRGTLEPFHDWTSIFIKPGHTFHAVDAMVTNFHLPRSTLLALVSAFAGAGAIKRAYAEAIAAGYRFYSFGDAMLML